MLKKPRYNNTCTSCSIPPVSFLDHLLPVQMWYSCFIGHNYLPCSVGFIWAFYFPRVRFFVGPFVPRRKFNPLKIWALKIFACDNLHVYGSEMFLVVQTSWLLLCTLLTVDWKRYILQHLFYFYINADNSGILWTHGRNEKLGRLWGSFRMIFFVCSHVWRCICNTWI